MYLPETFKETDTAKLHALVRAHPFATWVVAADGGLVANHLPLLLDQHGRVLRGHVARLNPVWRALARAGESLVIFHGPQHYVTPSWYPSKHAHGRVVPTWNYAVVHAHGTARSIDEAAWLRAHLDELTNTHEAVQAMPWRLDDAPADYLDQMIAGVVGIEIEVSSLEGKWKVNQNRSVPDRLGVVAGLAAAGDDEALAVAALVDERARSAP